jgi:Cu/Ag efflux protein CusF
MKMSKTKQTMVLAAVMTATAAFNAPADQATPAAGPEKCYTGQIVSIDPQNRTLSVQSWMLSKKEFNLGDKCAYVVWGINNSTAGDLRPGQKVSVVYQDSHGVRIADRVEQRPMQYEGMVTAIDFNKHTLTMHQRGFDEPMVIADGCNVTLRDNKPGVLTDIQPGDHVTVTYETPNDIRVARQIAQTSSAFTGRLTAIDLDQKMVKAKSTFETKKFNLADNCAIVIAGRTDGTLSQLKPGDRLLFNYDTVNGVNVVNRIAPAPAEEERNNLTTTTPGYPAYPTGF